MILLIGLQFRMNYFCFSFCLLDLDSLIFVIDFAAANVLFQSLSVYISIMWNILRLKGKF